MPAVGFSHTTRTSGTTLTASIYNGDFVNITDHFEPSYVDDYSANVSQSNTQTDPGETGSETLPTTLAGELAMLRFIIAEMKNTTTWRETEQSISLSVPTYFIDGVSLMGRLPSFSADTYVRALAFYRLRQNWVPGGDIDIKMRMALRDNVTGQLYLTYEVTLVRVGSATSVLDSGTISVVDPPYLVPVQQSIVTVSGASLLLGDILEIKVERAAGVGVDTLPGSIRVYDTVAQFSGYAGRV